MNKKGKILYISAISVISLMFVSMFAISLPENIDFTEKSFWIISTFMLNLAFFIYALVINLKKYPYSFSSLIWIFNIFFFFLSPCIQYLNNDWPWGHEINEKKMIVANLLIFLFSVIYEIVYRIFSKKSESLKKEKQINNIKNKFITKKSLMIVTLLSLVFVLIIMLRIDVVDMFSKYTRAKAFDLFGESSVDTLISNFARYYVMFVFLLNFKNILDNKKIDGLFIVACISFFIVCFPFSLTRFFLAAAYLGTYLVLTKKYEFLNRYFYIIFILLFMIAFPLFGELSSGFKSFSELINKMSEAIKNLNTQYLIEHYDAYANFIKSIEYVDNNKITMGKQLLGCVLFFVPRKIWPSKPVGSGAFVAESLEMSFTNISMPFIGEGYLNFGLLGVIAFAIVLAYLSSKMDYLYWKSGNEHINNIYPYLMILVFFCMRGDLMSSIAQIIALIVIYIGIVVFIKVLLKIKWFQINNNAEKNAIISSEKEDFENEHI